MKILCAPDSFKDALGASKAAAAIAQGIAQAFPDAQVDQCPISDGGEGFTQVLAASGPSQTMTTTVIGPTGKPVDARWLLLKTSPRTAVIEMAQAAGLELVPDAQRNPMHTTTFGVGQLIAAALDCQVQRIILGLGGSATTEGGCAMAQALGVRLVGVDSACTGADLQAIQHVDFTQRDPRLETVELWVACDVTNPLAGLHGAAHVYASQKGANPQEVQILDAGLAHLATLLPNDPQQPGVGAAGGLGYGAVAFLGGTLRPGLDLVLDAVDFDQRVAGCDLCLTGEGRLDGQSLAGKAVLGVARRAAKQGVPTFALVGLADDDAHATLGAGLAGYHVIGKGLTREQSIARTAELLQAAAIQVVRANASPDPRGQTH